MAARKLQITALGDDVPAESRALFLLDGGHYPVDLFPMGRESVTRSPNVQVTDVDGIHTYSLTAEGREQLKTIEATRPRVLFFVSSDTHVKTFTPIARLCRDFRFMVLADNDQLAIEALESEGFPWVRHSADPSAWSACDVALTGNDWGFEDRLFVSRTRKCRVPSVCLQESVIDFDGPMKNLCWADYPIIQGPIFLRFVQRDFTFLAGNPRYDTIRPLPIPEQPNVFINCNFTFGVHEEVGRRWVDDCVAVLHSLDLPYLVSVHPRCFTDTTGIDNVEPSNAYIVHQQLERSSIIITRFSSLAHEGLLMGRHVIYYNPHGEHMRLLNEDPSGLIYQARNPDELAMCLKQALEGLPPTDTDTDTQTRMNLQGLFCATDGRNHVRTYRALQALAAYHKKYYAADYLTASEFALKRRMFIDAHVRPRLKQVPLLRSALRAIRGAGR